MHSSGTMMRGESRVNKDAYKAKGQQASLPLAPRANKRIAANSASHKNSGYQAKNSGGLNHQLASTSSRQVLLQARQQYNMDPAYPLGADPKQKGLKMTRHDPT